MTPEFFKYQAMGNDMIVIDPARCSLPLYPEVIRLICDRHLGVGADGICFGPLSGHDHPFTMRFFNPDGSEAEKSGNGLRIFARYLWDYGLVREFHFTIAIGGDRIPVQLQDARAQTISLGMGRLTFGSVDAEMVFAQLNKRVTIVSIGNPHAVIFEDDLDLVHSVGPTIESAPQFPRRTNVQLVRVLDQHTIQIEIWERGAGYTISSGTSSSAAAGAAVKLGHCQTPVEVRMVGGVAQVAISSDWHVDLVGDVTPVYAAAFSDSMREKLADAAYASV